MREVKEFDWTRSTGHRLAGPTADDDMPDAEEEEEEPVGRRLGGAAFPADLPAPLAACSMAWAMRRRTTAGVAPKSLISSATAG